jgi:hypothetical protein
MPGHVRMHIITRETIIAWDWIWCSRGVGFIGEGWRSLIASAIGVCVISIWRSLSSVIVGEGRWFWI